MPQLLFPSARFVFLAFSVSLLSATPSMAQQSNSDESSAEVKEEAPLVLERQNVVGGPESWLNGLAAYREGNYELAEQEFRSVNNDFSDGVLASRFGGALSADFLFRIGGFDISGTGVNDRERTRSGVSSIEDSYAQSSYALGATLVKLGKLDEARTMFGKAVVYDKEIHDARVRMSLIDLLSGNTKTAEKQIKILTHWCEAIDCTPDSEVGTALTMIRSALTSYEQASASGESQN